MKSILLIAVLALFAIISPVSAVTDAGLEWDQDTVIGGNFASAYDTLVTASDSSAIIATARYSFDFNNATRINSGTWTYYVQIGRLTGTSLDTSNLCITVDGYTFQDSLIGRVRSDTSADRRETYMFKLPIGGGDAAGGDAFIADKYILKIKNVSVGGTAAAQCIINGVRIIKSRPITNDRRIGR